MRKSLLLVLSFCLLKISQSQIPSYIPKDSLVGWWPINKSISEVIKNDSVTKNGNGLKLSKDRFGIDSSSIEFNGSNFIETQISNLPTRNRTISFWIKINDTTTHQTILNYGKCCNKSTLVGYNVCGKNCFYLTGGVADHSLNMSGIKPIEWNLIIISIDSILGTKFYLNGKYQSSSNESVFENTTDNSLSKIVFGSTYDNNGTAPYTDNCVDNAIGNMDEIAIWNRILDSNEIKALYLGCKPPKHKPLTTSDTLTACSSIKLTSKNKNYSSYKWSNGDTTASATFNSSGLVTLLETDTNGCKNIDSVYVRLLKDEISQATDTTFYNLTKGDTLNINPSKWFGSNSYNFYNTSKSSINQIQLIYSGQDSIIWKGYASLMSNSVLKCPTSGKIFTKQLPDYIPKDSLVGWWPFNGNAKDESGNSNNTTIFGATTTTDRKGNLNCAYYLDGTDDYLVSNVSKLPLNNSSRTFSFWIQYDLKTNYNDWSAILSYGNGFGPTDYGKLNDIFIGPGNSNSIFYNNNEYGNIATYSKSLKNSWSHICVIYDNSNFNNFYIYINGEKQILSNINYATINELYTTLSELYIGRTSMAYTGNTYDGGDYFYYKGKIDDVAIWNRALDTNEIKALYLGCKPPKHKKLTASDTLFACTSLKLTSKNKNYASYKWSNGDTTTSTTITNSGLVTILETDTNGCKNIDSVYVRLLKDEISQTLDTSICNVQANDTLKLNLNNWFGTSDYYFYNKSKSQINTADVFVKNSASKKWTGFVALKTNTSLKCPVSGNIHPSVVYPGLLSKTTDTLLTSKTALKPAIVDNKYTTYPNYLWSNGDTTWTTNFNNSGSHWFKQTDSIGCSQTDSFHFSRINLSIPSKITSKLGAKVIVRVKDSLNTASTVVWSTGDTGWYTVYTVTKNTDTIFATQSDAYRSVTKFTVVTGRAEPIKTTEEWDNSEEDSNGTNTQNTAGVETSSVNSINVYPNPVRSEITLKGLTRLMNYEIHTTTGQLVQSGKTSQKINVEILQTGLYVLKLENVSVKFVKE